MPDDEPSNRAARPACDSSLPASMAPGGLKHFRSRPVIYYPDACPPVVACHVPNPRKRSRRTPSVPPGRFGTVQTEYTASQLSETQTAPNADRSLDSSQRSACDMRRQSPA